MKNRYEALLVLNSQGKEDSVHNIVDRLESEFKKEGAEIEQVIRKCTASITSGCARRTKKRSGRKSRRKSWRVLNKSDRPGAWPVLIKSFSSEI